MCKDTIGQKPLNTTKISASLQSVIFNSIRNVVSDELVEQTCREVDYDFRRRKITPVVTVLHMIMSAIWPEESFNACWQVLWDTFVSWFPQFKGQSPSRRRVAEARARLPLTLWRGLFQKVAQQAQQHGNGYDAWNGHRVVLADGTCLSMARTPDLVEAFGVNKGHHGRGRYPLARLVTLCLAGTMTILDYAVGRYRQGEWSLFATILGSLRQGDLLIADRHVAGAAYYVRYQREGLQFLTRAHHRLKISKVKRVVRYNGNDFIGRLNVNKLYRRKDPSLPTHIDVRFLKAILRMRGRRQVVWFATSLTDSSRYPADPIIELYARRWRIETLFREVKITLSADVLRSQSPDGIRKEIVARLTALNVVRTLMLEAAVEAQIEDPLRISFVHAIRALLSFSSALGHAPLASVPGIYQAMLTEIASHLNTERPGRLEPRAIRREHHHYPSLRITRAQWKARHHAA
ncbi:MAG: IS4 family transposase [Phycisphaerales bacterium]|nr:MAG: IS4 family transposase [Phycisphaerales bacterium]